MKRFSTASLVLLETDLDYSHSKGRPDLLKEFLEKSKELYLVEEPITPYVERYLKSTDTTDACEGVLDYYRNLHSTELLAIDAEKLERVYRLFLDEKGLNYNFKQKYGLSTLYLLLGNYADRGTVINMKFLYPLLKLCLNDLQESTNHIYYCEPGDLRCPFVRTRGKELVSRKLALELISIEFSTALIRFLSEYSKKPIPSMRPVTELVLYFSENVTENKVDPFPGKLLSLEALKGMKGLTEKALDNYLEELPEFLAREKIYPSPEDAERAFFLDAVEIGETADFLPYELLSHFDEAFQAGIGATGEIPDKILGSCISLVEILGTVENGIKGLERKIEEDIANRILGSEPSFKDNALWIGMSELDGETYLHRPPTLSKKS